MKRRFDGQAPQQGGVVPTAWQVPPGTELESAAPARPADLAADLLVPLAQALVTGALLAGLVTFLVWELAPDLDGEPVKVWLALAVGISSVAWLILLGQTRRLLWAIERVVGLDLDRDGATGRPGERVVIVNAGQAQAEAAQRADTREVSQFADFVRRLPSKGTSARAWESELGRDTYQEYRDALIKLGWAAWNSYDGDGRPNERRGWDLTISVDEILRRVSG